MKSYQEIIAESLVLFAHVENPKFEAEALLAFVLGCNRSHIIAFPERTVTDEEYRHYKDLLQQRLTGVPFAYLTGEKEFYDLILKVTPATLIPRADTELLVETALAKMTMEHPQVIDMGTGSGAIALTIKKHRPNAFVIGLDQSSDALIVAQENGENLQLAVNFIQSDWFANVPLQLFDFILANPPYIDLQDEHLTGDGVRFEPMSALVSTENGYGDLFHLIDGSLPYLQEGGWLMLEHGFEQGETLRHKFVGTGYRHVATLQDLSGNDRITIGQK